MSTSTATQDLARQILNHAAQGKLGNIEEPWLALLADPPLDARFYLDVADAYIKGKARKQGIEILLLAFEELEKRGQWRLLDQVIFRLAPYWRENAPLRQLADRVIRRRYGSSPEFDRMVAMSGLEKEGEPLDQILKRLRRLVRLVPGSVYQHKSWGEGVVRELDLEGGRLTLDFPAEKGKVVTLEGARKFLTYLPPSHFLARRAKDPEGLRALADDDPVTLIKLAIQGSPGPLKQAELKGLLTVGIVEASSWNSWWTRARREIAADPYLDFDSSRGAHAEISLRAKPKTLEEEIDDLIRSSEGSPAPIAAGLKKLAETRRRDDLNPGALRIALSRVEEIFATSTREHESVTLEFAYLSHDIRSLHDELSGHPTSIPAPEDILQSWDDYESLARVEHPDYASRALDHLMKRDGGDAIERAADLFAQAPSRLAQAIWKALEREGRTDLSARAVQALLDDPLGNPSTYLWAVRSILDRNWSHLDEYLTLPGMVMELIKGLEQWDSVAHEDSPEGEAARILLSRVKSLLSGRRYASICEASEMMTLEQAQRLRHAIRTNRALSDTFKSQAQRQLQLTRKDLDDEEAAQSEGANPVNYCTARMRAEKIRELDDLKMLKIPANRKAIQEAREEGDLRENAGYHAARDEQKILMQHAMQLQEALAAAQVIDASMVSADQVSFGTAFEAENLDTGETENYIILGRWEANPEGNILSILAPFAAQFLGKAAGDLVNVERPGGGTVRYRLVSISNALASGEWDHEAAAEATPRQQ
jgi:transcription elongation GreA/GreB family factor